MSDQIDHELDANAGVAPASSTPAARWEDFMDIFYAPSDVYARREHAGFGLPMFVVTVALGVIFLATFNAMSPIMDAEFARVVPSMIKRGAPAASIASSHETSLKFSRIMAFIFPAVRMFLTGLALWLCGKMVGARQALGASVMIASFGNVPRIIGALVGGVQALLMDPATLTSHHAVAFDAARFLDPDTTSPVVMAMLGRVDLFVIWTTILLAIGLAVVGKIPRSKAAIAALVVWVIGGLPEILGALSQ